jgi:hypothetical protein
VEKKQQTATVTVTMLRQYTYTQVNNGQLTYNNNKELTIDNTTTKQTINSLCSDETHSIETIGFSPTVS